MSWDVWTVSKPCLWPVVIRSNPAADAECGGEGSEGTIAAPLHRQPLRLGHPDLSVEELRSVLDYNPETGVLVWRERPGLFGGNLSLVGTEAGNVNGTGYRLVKYKRRLHLAHRLAWAHYYGAWPEMYIDHIDRNRLNNAICNLRQATRAQNKANSGKSAKAIAKGVIFKHGKFVARFRCEVLGRFDTVEEASVAYHAAAKAYFGDFAAGAE